MASNSEPQREQHEPVAIVGMGCRWPGGSHTSEQFWNFLCNKVDGWKEFDDPRFSSKGFHHPNSDRPGGFAMKGAFLGRDDARLFDHSFFGMTQLEVETMDPSQRKLLECAYEAIESAGESLESISGKRTGVFVGNFCLDHWTLQSRDWDNPRPYAFVGAGTSILANRISYIFNLQGPSLTIDTACSSSMYAVHCAVNAIRAGDCDSAIVAAGNWIADPTVQIALDKLGALSASSRCHTFDARAEGYARGEGWGAIYLKRPSTALADNSPIRAFIRGSAVNSNGRTGGITRPSALGQETVIREAYRNAGGLPFKDTSYFECHGTGTYVGDPIEVAAVGRVFASVREPKDPLLVGSVKSNVGHGEGASALASIMKVVLALERGAIPPVYDLQTRNPNIDFDAANVQPVTEVTPWPEGKIRRASINSFGYGGANAHCIIDHVTNVWPDYVAPGVFNKSRTVTNGHTNGHANGHTNGSTNGHTNGNGNGTSNGHQNGSVQHSPVVKIKTTAVPGASTRQSVLLPLSAHNEQSLKLNIEALAKALDQFPLADVAYTLGNRRSKFAQRSFAIVDKDNVANDLLSVIDKKPTRAPLHTASLGFIFTGQGAQWHAMGSDLFQYRIFQNTIQHLDHVLGTLSNAPAWSLYDILSGNCDPSLIQTAEVSQAACTAVQVALIDLLASWSIRPSGVAGHSSGEIAAAYASGRITAAEAIVAAYLRGQAVSRNKQTGAMLAVGLGFDDVVKYLDGKEDEVKVAAINSPGSVTLSGEEPTVDSISAAMTADSVFNRKLKTGGNAYHSHHMIPIGREYVELLTEGTEHLRKLGLASSDDAARYQPTLWVSSVTPAKSTSGLGSDDLASYWRANLESPVRFSEAVAGLVQNADGVPIHALVEIGPHPALKSPLEQILKAAGVKNVAYAGSTLKRGEGAQTSMLQLAGSLFALNSEVNIAAVNAVESSHDGKGDLEHGVTCVDLPPYQYTYGGLNYHESRASKEYRYRSILRHDLLGSKIAGNAKFRPQWRNILRLKDVPWLGDHRLLSDAVLPGAGYLAMAIEAIARIHNELPSNPPIEGFVLADVSIKKSLVIPEDDYGVEVLTSLELVDAQTPAWATFSISSVGRESEEWMEHCTGRIKVALEGSDDSVEKTAVVPTTQRALDGRVWYEKFAEIGLGYGETFQPISYIRSDPTSNVAVATLNLRSTAGLIKDGESAYPLHPASLDGAIQLGLIACHAGRSEDATTAFVPVQLPRLYLSNNINDLAGDKCTVMAHGEKRGIRGAHLDLQLLGPNGEVMLDAEGLRCISYSSAAKTTEDRTFSSPFTRLVWRPDIRTLRNGRAREMYPPPRDNVKKAPSWGITNKLAHFVVYSMYMMYGTLPEDDMPKPSGDVGHFFDWIKRKGHNDNSELMQEAREYAKQGLLLNKIDELVSEAPDVIEVQAAKLLHDSMADILFERRTGIDVLISEGLLTPLYKEGLLMTGIYPQLHNVIAGVAHSNSHLRVLEIGGGTGGATRIAMKAFNGLNGIKSYKDYTFTDISAGFLSGARESMADLRDVNFSVFDIEVDPVEQGYVEKSYDLIIACQVLHATSNMKRTLTNCRRLLKPGGQLVLVETTENFIVPGVVVGTFTGYWSGIPDGRVDAPFQSLASWDRTLKEAGFQGLDVVLDDFPEPHNTTSVILSTVPPEEFPVSGEGTVHLLHSGSEAPALLQHLTQEFQGRGITVKPGTLDGIGELPSESRVVALFDDGHLLLNASEEDFSRFQQLVRQSSSLVAITSSGVAKGLSPDAAVIPGLLRVLQNENPGAQYMSVDIAADNFTIEAAEDQQHFAKCIADYESELYGATRSPPLDDLEGNPKDRELSWQDGYFSVSRHVPDTGFHSQHGLDSKKFKPDTMPLGSQGAVKATFETPGVINSLCFEPYKEILQPLPAGFIDVAVAAVGLNARDLDTWTGRLDSDHFSSEYSGVITAVGANVDGLNVGDRVCGLGKGQFGTATRVPAAFASKVEDGDDLVQIASLPLSSVTAVYVLDHVAHIRKGRSILVQSGAKDVGLALISLAKAKGAQVFATAETKEEARFIVEKCGLLESHVLAGATSLAALQHAAQLTARGKFDVIVSTASRSHYLDSYLQVLSSVGHLVELDPQAVDSTQFTSIKASYSSVDIFSAVESDPGLGQELMQAANEYYRQGIVTLPPNVTTTDISQLSTVIGGFNNLIGKLVVRFDNPSSWVRMIPAAPAVTFDPDAAYVIAGALGGLGQSLVRWMGDRGARHLVLLSRRDISTVPDAQKLVNTLAKRDIHVESFVCDVSSKEQVDTVIQQISAERPIKGVVHAAVSYLDLTFDKLSASRWNDGLSAKVQGTKNLHEATLPMPLDFFVMTTSALSVFAFATQGAYTAANNFQDAFARYRRNLGLPASTASFSLIKEVTEVGTSDLTVDLFERNKTLTLTESQFLTMFEPAFLNNTTHTTAGAAAWSGKDDDPLSAANLHTYMDPAALMTKKRQDTSSSQATPKWYTDARISLMMRAFLDAQHHESASSGAALDTEGSKNTPASIRRNFEAAVAGRDKASTVEFVEDAITHVVADMLFVDVEGIDPAKSVADLGVDSLIAAELRNWFLQALGTSISMLDLLDPSVSISSRAEGITEKAIEVKG
ncbi:Type I Iterative PKS [Podospora pseudopauciseta]|uniref:Type I Iterative PKS n=1 Tax=Podospora pseudopauciseta TaxID=2093780 RepID=A0ABR0H6Z3_9PEZI|nr:Type I Iterative PKS [Podospora pseudopauciseta]